MRKISIVIIIVVLIVSSFSVSAFAANKGVEEISPEVKTEEKVTEDNADKESEKNAKEIEKETDRAEKKLNTESEKAEELAEKEAVKAEEKAAKEAKKTEGKAAEEQEAAIKDEAKSKLEELKTKFKGTEKESRQEVLDEIASAKRAIGDKSIGVFVNGEDLDFSKYDNVLPEIENDRVLVPIRAVIETFGADVTWNEETSTVIIACGDTVITMQPDNKNIFVNGEEFEVEAAPKIVHGRILAPMRVIAEALGMDVSWDENSHTVVVD